ncbi:MAG TPA: hypothetical protein DCR24_14075 [Bacillus bacterium]|nr:hypothetical protein [Bacillus sp. (in: firmicutes)]
MVFAKIIQCFILKHMETITANIYNEIAALKIFDYNSSVERLKKTLNPRKCRERSWTSRKRKLTWLMF